MNARPQAATHQHASRPLSPEFHIFGDHKEAFALNVETGRLLKLPPGKAETIRAALELGDIQRAELLTLGLRPVESAPFEAPETIPLKALSLAIAQKCNLGCTYCYAQQGTFGGQKAAMADEVAKASVDRLLADAQPGDRITVGFMGGEPLVNRKTLHKTTEYAAQQAGAKGVEVGFSLTTNATLLRPEDIELFQRYGFMLTVSLDGLGNTNDRLRPFADGRGSFERVERHLETLLAVPNRRFTVNARVTVTPVNLDLPTTLEGLVEMGFDGIQFSPMLSAPSGKAEMHGAALDEMLEQMNRCGKVFEAVLEQGKVLPFTNVVTQLKRIHSRHREHYPCGAGGGYMAVSAQGKLSACHRFVDDEVGQMGSLSEGIDQDARTAWLETRALEQQNPCGQCWARYLCSGSCHYEVLKKGRPACDYIRGWLHYCLGLYGELAMKKPEMLGRILSLQTTA